MAFEQLAAIPSSLLPSHELVLDWGQGGNVVSLWTAFCRGFDHIPSVPPSLFNGFNRVVHSLAIWPQPWHLKHCRVLESFTFWALSWVPVGAWVFPLPWEAVVTLLAVEELWAVVFWPRPVWPLLELGWTGVFLSVCRLPWPLWLGLLECWQGECPVQLCLEQPLA